jgi:hypothetical protein
MVRNFAPEPPLTAVSTPTPTISIGQPAPAITALPNAGTGPRDTIAHRASLEVLIALGLGFAGVVAYGAVKVARSRQ